ncbi:MAG TPA: hypothetical protein VJ574_01325 [Candidatus Bathyarchaeia archaeon]|nr:MAG: hypothetical protein A3K70_03945 [Candidatus Bathyarchaeota archaeon RBG_16_48_13]HJX23036.1 hypothetical protein [Candidatus Bathyarchaeia archaeon]
MREKEIGESLGSAAGFVENAMEDLKEGRPEELDLNIWKALESIEYAAFLLSLEDILSPEKRTRHKGEKGQEDAVSLTNTLDLLREGVKIADLGSESRSLSKCVWNARRILLRVQRNRLGRS